jgi:hypothetical protein
MTMHLLNMKNFRYLTDFFLHVIREDFTYGEFYNLFELISLDPVNYPVPAALQKLKRVPSRGVPLIGGLLKPAGSPSSKREIHVWFSNDQRWRYLIEEDKWKESGRGKSLQGSALVFHRETNRVYVTGGCDDRYRRNASAQFTEDGATFHSLPKMPEEKGDYHRMTVTKSGNIFVASDDIINEGKELRQVCFLYEKEKNQWKMCPNVGGEERWKKSCGAIRRRDGKEEIVVAGGSNGPRHFDTVDIFSLEESRWRSGMNS